MAKKSKSAIPQNIPTALLSEVAAITKGPVVKNEEGKGVKKVNIITLSDLLDTVFVESASKEVKVKEKFSVAKKSFLEPYDVLFPTIGNFDKVGIFPNDMKGNWICHQSMFRIRFKENQQDNAVAFVMFLMSPAGKAVIEKIQVGSKVKSISKKSLSVIKIPQLTPDIKKQSKTLFNKEIKMIQKIVELSASIEELRNSYLIITE